jgi:TonB-linked SusC/RagA family outer membrane protein
MPFSISKPAAPGKIFILQQLPQNLPLKALFLMNLTAILLLAGCLQVSAAGYSQGKITLSLKNAPLEKVFASIETQSGYTVWYDYAVLKNTNPIDIDVKDLTLEQTLAIACKNQPLDFSIVGKMVVLKEKKNNRDNDPPNMVGVKGKVVNEKGEPLAGASVFIQGTRIGTRTDLNGEFFLPEAKNTTFLVITYTGYQSKVIRFSGQQEIVIMLSISASPLDQIQVIAYGTSSKRLSTGNISTINAETIAEQPVSNTLGALEGRVPGLVITQQTGVPGGGFTVQIRGQNSIASGNNPFYIIDGVPFTSTPIMTPRLSADITEGGSPFSTLNPYDIESIEVLKDADATAIYGSRGANGVILITTKKGKAGKTKFDFHVYNGAGGAARKMPLLNTSQYLQMRHEAFANDGTQPNPSSDYDLTTWDTTRYTDWQKVLIGGTAHITDAQGDISGGNENTQFLIGGNYHRESTVFPGDFADQKGSAHLNLSTASTDKKFRANVTASYVSEQNNLLSSDFDLFNALPPDAPRAYDSTGKLNWENGTFNNPLGYLLQKYQAHSDNLIGNATISYQILPGLQVRTSAGYTKLESTETLILPGDSYNPSWHVQSSAQFGTSSLITWILEPQLEYTIHSGKNRLNLLAGSTFQNDARNNLTEDASGFSSDALLENIAAASTISVNNTYTYTSQYRYNAFFARANYQFDEKYIFSLNGRRDGSSRFGPGKQFANFGSVGAAWIFSKEIGIAQGLPALSFGKLRLSYGLTGNDQIGDYRYLSTYFPTTYPYQGMPGLEPTALLNPNYGWETVRKLEAGLNLGFWKDRILLEVDYYRNRTSNQLVNYALPTITGFNGITANLPATVQNKGLEFELNTVNIRTKQFTWTSSFNLTVPQNLLLSYPNIASSSYANTYVVGKPLSIIMALHYTGVDPATGVYTFQDVNHNGSDLDIPGDLEAIKEVAKAYYGGLFNHFAYKGFGLDIFLQFVKQTGYNYLAGFTVPGLMANQPTTVLGRWQHPGDKTNVEEYTQGSGTGMAFLNYLYAQIYGDNRISDASFIRLKNIYLSYTVPLGKVVKIEMLKIFLQGQNLLTITHYLGMDPENNGTNLLPPLKILTGGLQINF